MKDDYFDVETIMKLSLEEVDKELDSLNDEVYRITKGVGCMQLSPLHEEEAKIFFGDDALDENYYLLFKYTNDKTHTAVRNKFVALSYSETYPVLAKPLKTANTDVVKFDNSKDFHKFLKKIVNDESVLRSIRIALKQAEDKK